MRQILKNMLILLSITLVSGLCLGFVYQITKEPIRIQEEKTKQKANLEVFSDAASFEADPAVDLTASRDVLDQAGYVQEEITEVLAAKDASGAVLGYVLTVVTHEGYGGDITFSMGVQNDGTLNGISILSISETAGLGMKANTEDFRAQFQNKKAEKFAYTKTGAAQDSEIDAISGATITTNAMTNGVDAGLAFFKAMGEGGKADE